MSLSLSLIKECWNQFCALKVEWNLEFLLVGLQIMYLMNDILFNSFNAGFFLVFTCALPLFCCGKRTNYQTDSNLPVCSDCFCNFHSFHLILTHFDSFGYSFHLYFLSFLLILFHFFSFSFISSHFRSFRIIFFHFFSFSFISYHFLSFHLNDIHFFLFSFISL